MRLIDSVASTVWIVESTRWPVSAAESAVCDGLLVAHLADQDHVGVLAQHAAQRALERGGVHADLALVDHRALVAVHELDRVLDRDDVLAASCELMWSIIAASVVDLPEPVVPVSSTIPRSSSASSRDHRRQRELLDRADPVRDRAADDRDHARAGWNALMRKRATPGIS